ncbi:tetratricopeptide (TPR) repeat protein [Desulfobaculum xiamenense]|uniref:Tetratricopeptide (TPR) repeat protein n=1 Tax=Desulfobaculum xiamenense TaxID=995050 RepID=A0A846QD35_9BACT|nr:tetratricopeptide repeat protein [Desulfobaculum xiamenense]NJB66636.1 tetratricopeptide (TPR) repeat protein [Desulfobaculum xiamenense]
MSVWRFVWCAAGALGAVLLACVVSLHGASAADGVDPLVFSGSDALYHGELERAEKLFSQAAQHNVGDVFVLNQWAVAVARQERFAEAGELFARVLRSDPDNLFALTWTGILALERGDARAGEVAFAQVLTADPGNANALYLLGVVRAAANDMPRAVDLLRRSAQAVRLRGGDPDLHYRLGLAYRRMGMPANAELELERAVELRPDYGLALVELGWVRHAAGRGDAAMEAWMRAANLPGPAGEEARASMAAIVAQDAQRAAAEGNFQRADGLWREVLRWEPNNRAALHHLR